MSAVIYTHQARGQKSAEVFIYGDIGRSWNEESVTAKQFVDEINALDVAAITVRINSVGGSVPDGLAIYNALKRHKATVTTSVDALAASIASLIAMAGDTVGNRRKRSAHDPRRGPSPWEIPPRCVKPPTCSTALPKPWRAPINRGSQASTEAILALLTGGTDHWYSAGEAVAAGFCRPTVSAIPWPPPWPPASTPVSRRPRRAVIPAAAAAQPAPKGNVATEKSPLRRLTSTPPPPPKATSFPPPWPSMSTTSGAGLQQEAARRNTIKAIAKPFMQRADLAALTNAALDDPSVSVETVRAKLLQAMGRDAQPLGGGLLMTIEDRHDKFRPRSPPA